MTKPNFPTKEQHMTFCQAVAQGLGIWQLIEAQLFYTFSRFLHPADWKMCSCAFYGVTSLEGKLRILKKMGDEFFHDDEDNRKEFKKLMEQIKTRSNHRNKLAHRTIVTLPDGIALFDTKLNRYKYNESTTSEPLTVNDIAIQHQKASATLNKLYKFNQQIDKRLGTAEPL